MSLLSLASAAGAAQSADNAPPQTCTARVGLNHFYVVLDEETYAAVRSSDFVLRELANVDAGLPAFREPDAASERIFVRGKNTYLELFRPDNRFGEPVGKVGIALGVDRTEDLDCLESLWTDRLDGATERTRVERQTEGGPVPWYDAVYRPITSNNADLVMWAAGYRPEFLPWLYPARSPEENGVARADFLGPRFAPDRLLEDVVAIVVAASEALRLEVAHQLEGVGFRRAADAESIVLEGYGWSLVLTDTSEKPRGLLEVHIRTTAEKERSEVVHLGPRSRLEFGPGRHAVWYFE